MSGTRSNDRLPTRRADQLAMAKSWATILATKGTQWDILPPEVTILNGFITSAQEALNLAMSGNLPKSLRLFGLEFALCANSTQLFRGVLRHPKQSPICNLA